MIEWFLVETEKDDMPRWCQIAARRKQVEGQKDEVESFWVNGLGRAYPRTGQNVFVHVEADRDRDLITNHKAATFEIPFATLLLLEPDSDSGLVAPNGQFWGCSSARHEWLVHSFLRRGIHDLSEEGWVRVCGDSVFYGKMTGPSQEEYGGHALTQPQIDSLFDMGFSDIGVKEWPHKRIWKDRRGEADKLRPFAVRQWEADAMKAQIIRTRCKPAEKPASAPGM